MASSGNLMSMRYRAIKGNQVLQQLKLTARPNDPSRPDVPGLPESGS